MTYSVFGIKPNEPIPRADVVDERQPSPILRGRNYRVVQTPDMHMLRGWFLPCYQLRQPADAPVDKTYVCSKQTFEFMSEAMNWIEYERSAKGLDFNIDPSERRGVIYTSRYNLFKDWWAGKVSFKSAHDE